MKTNKILAATVAALFGASAAQADIALTDNLSLSGYIDGTYENLDQAGNDSEDLGVKHIEIDFAFTSETVSAQVHIDDQGAGGDVQIEQAYVNYNLGNGIVLTGGKMLNTLGWEKDEEPDLYQTSYAYNETGFADTLGRRYNNGVRAAYNSDLFNLTLSGYDMLWSDRVGPAADDLDMAYEIFAAYTGVENLTIALGYGEDDGSDAAGETAEALNIWAQYEVGAFTIAAEYSDLENGAGTSGDQYLILGNYAFSEKGAITVRYSEQEWDGGAEFDKFTISPGYAVTDNLYALIEYSTGENAGVDYDFFAVETTFTF
jgi:hypothetical protein